MPPNNQKLRFLTGPIRINFEGRGQMTGSAMCISLGVGVKVSAYAKFELNPTIHVMKAANRTRIPDGRHVPDDDNTSHISLPVPHNVFDVVHAVKSHFLCEAKN